MMQAQTSNSLFTRLCFVLMETSHPGNIGAAARAIKTMGFSELILVNPRFKDALEHPDAIAFASGALDVLQTAQVVGSLDEALDGCNFAVALSARLREYSPPVLSPRAFAEFVSADAALNAAVVFGSERYGLSNDAVSRCSALINIPSSPEYSSLNLAQAVQLMAYECRVAATGDERLASEIGFRGVPANHDQIHGMYDHLEQALVAIDFLDPENPKKLMPRLKRMFSRAGLETEEVNILRGIATRILKTLDSKR